MTLEPGICDRTRHSTNNIGLFYPHKARPQTPLRSRFLRRKSLDLVRLGARTYRKIRVEELIGKRLVIGIPGTKITPEIVKHFKALNAGGLILYRINFESPLQLKKLISDLENALGRKLLVMADHEGGRVVMFRDAVTVFPDNLALGTAGKVEYASRQGSIEARELRRLGIDVNLSPVLDVLTDDYSPNIGIRSYGKDWRLVSRMGSARIDAMQKTGLSACAKHFPGKGHAPVDAHLGLPVIKSTWKEMEETHLKPFVGAIKTGIDVIMTSHPYYPNLDPGPGMIATFSRKIVRELLREKLGFEGIICSDDLEMGAIKAICSIEEAAIRAVSAGHDILLICHDMEAQKKVYKSLLAAYKEKNLPVNELVESAAKIDKLINKRPKRFAGGRPRAEPGGKKFAEKIARESVTVLTNAARPSLRKKEIAVIFPRFSSLANKIMIEKEMCTEDKFLTREFKKHGIKTKNLIISIEPAEEDIKQAARLSKSSDTVILFCFDAHLYPSNKKLLDAVQTSGKETVIALLRDPYDVEFAKKTSYCLTDFGWRACQIKAAITLLCSR